MYGGCRGGATAGWISVGLEFSRRLLLFLLRAGGAFGSLGLRGFLTLGASVLFAELSALGFGLLEPNPGFLPGFFRGGFSTELGKPPAGGLTVMLELCIDILESLANCADVSAGSGLDRGGDESPLAELPGETPRATTPPDSSWFRTRSAVDMLNFKLQHTISDARERSPIDLQDVSNCAVEAVPALGPEEVET